MHRDGDPERGTASRRRFTAIVPPCISTMRFEIARPRPVPFLACRGIVDLLEGVEDPLVVGSGDPRAGIGDGDLEVRAAGPGADFDRTGIRELDGVADEVEEDLGEAPPVAASDRKVPREETLRSRPFA